MQQQDYQQIVSILEQIFNCKITTTAPDIPDLSLDFFSTDDDIAIVKNLISNQHLLTSDHVNSLIVDRLNLPDKFKEIKSYADYKAELTDAVAGVKYRVAAGQEYQKLLPSQQQLFALHDACVRFTGNSAHFYLQYIKMCELANIVRYKYVDLKRCIASDKIISIIDMEQRNNLSSLYLQDVLEPYIRQGGILAHGRSDIDATSVSNLFYYKHARLLLYYQLAKELVTQALQVSDYAQLPQQQREQLWQALQEAFAYESMDDKENIFYRFIQYINQAPGELYNHFSHELEDLGALSADKAHLVMQSAGLAANKLVLISRSRVENWHPKRFLSLQWLRKYPLELYTKKQKKLVRKAGSMEQIRIWPNELPYFPGHGLSICGNGLVEGFAEYGTAAYEFNIPRDPTAQITNVPRDVEKLFREMQLFYSPTDPINIFQNPISYSSIQNTQHCHLIKGTIQNWPVYLFPAKSTYKIYDASCEFVPVGDLPDAFFLRVIFNSLDNEPLIKFLIELNVYLHDRYNGSEYLDVELHIFRQDDQFVFIYEPHSRLQLLQNGRFYNPDLNVQTYRKPQYYVPMREDLPICEGEASNGKQYLKDYFDKTAKPEIYQIMRRYITEALDHPE